MYLQSNSFLHSWDTQRKNSNHIKASFIHAVTFYRFEHAQTSCFIFLSAGGKIQIMETCRHRCSVNITVHFLQLRLESRWFCWLELWGASHCVDGTTHEVQSHYSQDFCLSLQEIKPVNRGNNKDTLIMPLLKKTYEPFFCYSRQLKTFLSLTYPYK